MSYLRVALDIYQQSIVQPDFLPPTFWFAKEITILIKNLFCRHRDPKHQEDIVQKDQNPIVGEIATLDLLQTKIRVLAKTKTLVQSGHVDCSQYRQIDIRVLPTVSKSQTEQLDCRDNLRKIEQELQTSTNQDAQKIWKLSCAYLANLPKLDICAIDAVGFHRSAIYRGATIFVTSLYKIDYILEKKSTSGFNLPGRLNQEPTNKEIIDLKLLVQYKAFRDIFSKAAADKLPLYCIYNYKIKLEDSSESLKFCLLYQQTTEKLLATKKYITEYLSKSFIESSQALFTVPILFVQKANSALQLCIDFCKLNSLTWKDWYLLLFIDKTLARLRKAKIFTKLNIQRAFYQICMHFVSKELTSFWTCYSTFKYKVFQEGLTNSLATYQQYINNILFDYLDNFCTVYLDNILIYLSDKLEYQSHIQKVLLQLREAGLQIDICKSKFYTQKTKYLGFIISTDGIETDPEKTAVIGQQEPLWIVKGI